MFCADTAAQDLKAVCVPCDMSWILLSVETLPLLFINCIGENCSWTDRKGKCIDCVYSLFVIRSSVEICSFWISSCSDLLWETRSDIIVVLLVTIPVNSDALKFFVMNVNRDVEIWSFRVRPSYANRLCPPWNQ